ncbi:MAG TPA: sigma-70 family RNA polymerase sigma factor [Edaphocola sp.]|nr:sigma-70 family RNA polymerase sigma factor [Edaphocola sp.]
MELEIENISEEEALKRILSGEKELFEKIIRKYNPLLFKIGRSYGFNHEDSEDIMQDTYIDIYKNLSQFHNHSSFKTWVFRIMLNNCYRKRGKFSYKNEFSKEEINENKSPMFTSSEPTFQETVDNKELRYLIEEALIKIPYDYRMVFTLREMNCLSTRETADTLQISESNVKVRLSRGKEMLKTILGKDLAIAELFGYTRVHCDPFTEKTLKDLDGINI